MVNIIFDVFIRHASFNKATVLRQDRQDHLAVGDATLKVKKKKNGSPMIRTVCIPPDSGVYLQE